ncbi:acyltransferase [Oceanimonas baumannii]|uniref:acyltransferase n=1 Tax=Oceanimonas baumannii TaxID=129578 RepID=UPI001D1847CB|nr:acyltransferase [Oceanimonas baumannii]MCC4263496.1 acyltransferase [Oceanimonas baumannii]
MDNGNGKIKIDEGTSIGKALIVSYEPNTIDIGKNCMLSYDIEIRNTDSHSIISLDNGERINKGKDVIIRDNVWIGAYSKVLKGSIISEHSVIGMSSVVTGNIPENSVAAGNPAKILRNNITWNKELL